jgi:hypothetical protein
MMSRIKKKDRFYFIIFNTQNEQELIMHECFLIKMQVTYAGPCKREEKARFYAEFIKLIKPYFPLSHTRDLH